VVPKGYYQYTKMSDAKVTAKRVGRKKVEEDRDYWFNRSRTKLTWEEKWLAKEENGSSGGSSGEEE
jgi:hypothetical protein